MNDTVFIYVAFFLGGVIATVSAVLQYRIGLSIGRKTDLEFEQIEKDLINEIKKRGL